MPAALLCLALTLVALSRGNSLLIKLLVQVQKILATVFSHCKAPWNG